ncbi:MAG: putative zinc-binding protein [Candidatus Thorarchaeota archaeon]
MSDAKKIVIPCSGIGKAFGTVSREATYQLTETAPREEYRTMCLPLLVAGDQDAIDLLKKSKVYTIDGCPKKCATLSVERTGIDVAMEVMVPKVLAKNTDHKPGTVLDIGPNGVLLAKDIVNIILEEGSD